MATSWYASTMAARRPLTRCSSLWARWPRDTTSCTPATAATSGARSFRNMGSKFDYWCDHVLVGIPRDLETEPFRLQALRRGWLARCATRTRIPTLRGCCSRRYSHTATSPIVHRAREAELSGYGLQQTRESVGKWIHGVLRRASAPSPPSQASCSPSLALY